MKNDKFLRFAIYLPIYESYIIRGLGQSVVYSHYKKWRMSSVLCGYHDTWSCV